MKICNFTQSELDMFREECNFTDIESHCFEAKARDKTDIQLAIEMSISESTVAVIMRRVRSKISAVLRNKVQHIPNPDKSVSCTGCPSMVYHTMTEWARIPDFKSTRGVVYVYADYRTETIDGIEVNVPRIKIGDGIHSISELPFATMSIIDRDMEYWDDKPDTENNNFGKITEIDGKFVGSAKFIFPSDGYLMLEFQTEYDAAKVKIYGANEQSYFEFEKPRQIDIHSKEVFVKKGMKCEYVYSTGNAVIKFISLV